MLIIINADIKTIVSDKAIKRIPKTILPILVSLECNNVAKNLPEMSINMMTQTESNIMSNGPSKYRMHLYNIKTYFTKTLGRKLSGDIQIEDSKMKTTIGISSKFIHLHAQFKTLSLRLLFIRAFKIPPNRKKENNDKDNTKPCFPPNIKSPPSLLEESSAFCILELVLLLVFGNIRNITAATNSLETALNSHLGHTKKCNITRVVIKSSLTLSFTC